ncbi:uncharacterized protein LOC129728052 [Wyeomyia smithii]|uniref:uncharacterized protein LOC129728052 n=1 Tax=Wyeomyia smithii TaxID=174621 RepID=UPI002467F66D|nr:uncharacterized protein LOC129728052 [Wyeomyia smithii]
MKFDVMYDRIEQISGQDYADYSHLRVRKFNRTVAVLDGSFDVHQPLDNNFKVSLTTAYSSLGNNQFIQYPMRLASQRMCDFLNTTWTDYHAFYQNNTDFPQPGECPIAPKQYLIENHIMDSRMFSPYMPRGFWKLQISLTKGNVLDEITVFQLNVYVKVEPKGTFY